jgi:hypothetical protein
VSDGHTVADRSEAGVDCLEALYPEIPQLNLLKSMLRVHFFFIGQKIEVLNWLIKNGVVRLCLSLGVDCLEPLYPETIPVVIEVLPQQSSHWFSLG